MVDLYLVARDFPSSTQVSSRERLASPTSPAFTFILHTGEGVRLEGGGEAVCFLVLFSSP